MPVYTDLPTGTATSAVHSHCSPASASGPASTYLENDVWSKTVTAVRVLTCSSADHGSQFCLPHEYSMIGSLPGGAKKLARSHPIRLPKFAPSATRRWCTGERRNGRAVFSSRLGQGIS